MKILLVKKSTNLDIHGERIGAAVKAGLVSKAELLSLEEEHRQHVECLDELRGLLTKNKVQFVEVGREDKWPTGTFDYVLSHGGDGTLLTAAQHMTGKSILAGICSTDTSVGHLCAVRRSQVGRFIELMLQNKLPTKPISRMQACISRINGTQVLGPPALNDILYTHAHPAGMSRYRLSIGDVSEEQKSSGIWIATAMGSTAAIKAAGGKTLPVGSRDFQFLIRERYRRASGAAVAKDILPTHQVFDPDQTKVVIFNRSAEGILAFDGQRSTMDLEFGDKITFARAHDLNLVSVFSA